MELGVLTELLYTAHRRFRNIHLAWQYQYEEEKLNLVQERWAAESPAGSVGILRSSFGETLATGTIKVHRRLWWRKPDCWHSEEQIEGRGSSVTVLCDDHWWMRGSTGALLTSEMGEARGNPPPLSDLVRGVPMLDPSFLLTSHELELTAEMVYAGRPALRARATYQKNREMLHEAFFWASADAYDLLVDEEYGILLRYAALLDGQEFAAASVEQVVFDEPISDEVFAFPPVS